jgi:NAD(P)H-flavin reductase
MELKILTGFREVNEFFDKHDMIANSPEGSASQYGYLEVISRYALPRFAIHKCGAPKMIKHFDSTCVEVLRDQQ